MSTGRTADVSREQLRRELEAERTARRNAEAEAGRHRKLVDALQRLASAEEDAGASEDAFLRGLLEVFTDVAGLDVAVIRIRENDRLRSRAAVGLDDEVEAGFSVSLDDGFMKEMASTRQPILIAPDRIDDICKSPHLLDKGVRSLYCLPLLEGDALLGVLYLGMFAARELDEDVRVMLSALATRAAACIARYVEREAFRKAILSRDQVLGVVAHDLRNPISVISMAADSLHQRVSDASVRRAVERVMRAAQRADHLIRDLLEVNAIEAGRFSIDTRRLDTASTILAAIESQQGLAASASVILRSDISPELAPVEADEERLLEVFENLIGNAVKFTNAGGTVTVGANRRAKDILVWVADSGPGIPADQLPHLFDRFWQASKRDRRGTGLGLTICKAIVEAHGGQIWAESTVGAGTTMYFTIPAHRDGPRVDAPIANILLVDDRPENLVSLEAILERPDYRLVKATSGEEALRLALRERFSVALIDIAMPGMDGLEVAVHMKELERSRDIPIIFITAFGDDPEEIHRAYSAGGADYLVKPLDAEIVRKKVAVFVDLSRRGQQGERISGGSA